MGKEHHEDQHAQSHGTDEHLKPIDLSTKENSIEFLSRMSEKLGSFLPASHHHGHSHGHGHDHDHYVKPEALTVPLAIFSLRKLSQFRNTISQQDKKVLDPVQQGVLSWVALWSLTGTRAGYAVWTYMLGGPKALLGPRFLLTQLALFGLQKITMFGIDNTRQMIGNRFRRQLVRKYRILYGDQFLLDALNPEFILGKFAYPQNHYGTHSSHDSHH